MFHGVPGCEYKTLDVLVLTNHSVRQYTICPAGFHIQLRFKLVGQCFTLKREQEGPGRGQEEGQERGRRGEERGDQQPIFLTTKLKH